MEPLTSPLDALLRRDRRIVIAGLAALTTLAWVYIVWMANAMGAGQMADMAMPYLRPWSAVDFLLTFLM